MALIGDYSYLFGPDIAIEQRWVNSPFYYLSCYSWHSMIRELPGPDADCFPPCQTLSSQADYSIGHCGEPSLKIVKR